MLNRTQAPPTVSPVDVEFKLPPCSQRTLDNGIPLYAVNDCMEPVVQVELVFAAGAWYEAKKSVAQATAALIKSGTSTKTSLQINEAFEQYGASVKAGAGNDWAFFSVSCMTRHLGKLLPLMAELLADTQFPQHELDIYIQNAKQRLSVQLKKSDFVANRLIDQYLFGAGHPYGKYTHMEDLDQIGRDDLLQHVQRHFHPANCRIFMAGQFGDAETELVNQYFGQVTTKQAASLPPEYQVAAAAEKKYRVTNDPTGVQGAIRLLRDFPEKHHPDFTPMIVLNTLFGGYFGSRLMSNIREDKGYTYGIHSLMYNNVFSSAYLITTEAGRDVCEATLEEIYKEMKRLQDEPVGDEELALVKNYLLGSILGDLDGAFHIIQRWKNIILNNFTEQRFYDNIRIYKSITPAELQDLANRYLKREDFYELVVV